MALITHTSTLSWDDFNIFERMGLLDIEFSLTQHQLVKIRFIFDDILGRDYTSAADSCACLPDYIQDSVLQYIIQAAIELTDADTRLSEEESKEIHSNLLPLICKAQSIDTKQKLYALIFPNLPAIANLSRFHLSLIATITDQEKDTQTIRI